STAASSPCANCRTAFSSKVQTCWSCWSFLNPSLFGRFLNFRTAGSKSGGEAPGASIPPSLTERRFRKAWRKTRGAERDRFAAVVERFRHVHAKFPVHSSAGEPSGFCADIFQTSG